MAWKPKLPVVSTEVLPMERRPWVAVAEKHAESAVNLFVNVMKNPRISMKLRMEAATRIVMIAGATFRGERKDGNGRPAANNPLPGKMSNKLSPEMLRQALSSLPPGSVIEAPEEAPEGEMYVVLHDGDHSRKPTGMLVQTPIGATVVGETPREEATEVLEMRLAIEDAIKEDEMREAEKNKPVPPSDPKGYVNFLLKQGGTKRVKPDGT